MLHILVVNRILVLTVLIRYQLLTVEIFKDARTLQTNNSRWSFVFLFSRLVKIVIREMGTQRRKKRLSNPLFNITSYLNIATFNFLNYLRLNEQPSKRKFEPFSETGYRGSASIKPKRSVRFSINTVHHPKENRR